MRRIHKGTETRWLQEMKQAIIKKTRLCMLIMAGLFFLLIMIQSGLYAYVPQPYQSSIRMISQWGKWGLIAGEIVTYAVIQNSGMEGV